MNLKKNMNFDVVINDITYEGLGVAHVEGMPIYIENALPNEHMTISITKVLSKFAYARVVEIMIASPERVAVIDKKCTWVGIMLLQHMSYDAQCAFKTRNVKSILSQEIALDDVIIRETIHAPQELGYRNKAQIPVREFKGTLETGMYKRNTHTLVPMDNYRIQDPEIDATIRIVRDALRIIGETAYDEENHNGNIRNIIVRRSDVTKEVMVIIVTLSGTICNEDAFIENIKHKIRGLVSVIIDTNDKMTNTIMGYEQRILWGQDVYHEVLMGKKFAISAPSFFQVNVKQTENLYRIALDLAEVEETDCVVDAYCGLGSITLNLADKAKHVYGIEIVEDAIRMAKHNAALNDIQNITFEAGSAEEILPRWISEGLEIDVLVVDPPRKGLDKAFIDASVSARPKRIVYVSCNPVSLARDLKIYEAQGYKTAVVQPVDMFPQTTHVETVVLLSGIKGKKSIQVDIDLNDSDLTKAESKATYQQIQEYVEEKHNLKVSSLYIAQVKRKHGIIEAENYNKRAKGSKQPNVTLEKQKAIEDALSYYQMIFV